MSLDKQFNAGGDATATATSGQSTKNRRRGGCLKKIGIFLLITIPVGLFLLNGPGFRWLAEFGIRKGAETQGLSGHASVTGTILSGFSIGSIAFTGDGGGPVESVQVGEVKIDYSLSDLIREGGLGWLKAVHLSDLKASIVLPDTAEEKEPKAEAESPRPGEKKELSEILSLVLALDYDLQNISVSVTRGETVFVVDDFNLDLPAGKPGTLKIGKLEIPGAAPRESVSTDIEATPTSLALGPLAILDPVVVESVTIDWADPEGLGIDADLILSGGRLSASYGNDGAISVSLDEGAISLPELLAILPYDDLKSGSITALDVDFRGDPAIPATWDSSIALELDGAQWKEYRAEALEVSARIDPENGRPETVKIRLEHAAATLAATSTASFAEITTPAGLAEVSAHLDANFDVAEVEALIAEFLPEKKAKIPATGSLKGTVVIDAAKKDLVKTRATLQSNTLAYNGISVDSVAVTADLEKRNALTANMGVTLDPSNVLKAAGSFDLDTFAYQGTIDLESAITERVTSLLEKFAFDKKLEGAATLQWAGSGQIREKRHRGEAAVVASAVRIEGAEVFDARFGGNYDEALNIEINSFALDSDLLQAKGELTYLDSVLKLRGLEVRADDLLLLKGSLTSPLDRATFKEPVTFFAQDGPLEIDIESDRLALSSVLGLFHQEPPIDCLIGIDLEASGTPADLRLNGKVIADEIVVAPGKNAVVDEKVRPARVEVDLAIAEKIARLGGRLEQPQIQPFVLSGSIPFTPAQWLEGTREFKTEPIEFTAVMKESDLGILTDFVPVIEAVEGTLDLDASVGGTLNKPEVHGASHLKVDSLRLVSSNAPSVRDLAATIRFADQAIHVDQFTGILAGGVLGLKGTVGIGGGAPPEFDLRLGGHEVLVFRSDSLSLRTDLNLSLTGPYTAATLAGTIGITNSLFYKDIDLLPLGAIGIGGEKSAVPEVDPDARMPLPKSLEVGVPIEPFKNWNVDLRILTLDPFQVAGNLAQATAHCDLRIGETLGAPVPDGRLWIEKAQAKLPFSRVEISEGEVKFDATTGFNGELGVRGRSNVGDHYVKIYVHNRLLDPKVVFTSVPPESREDILSLLASGSTRDELTDGGGAAATKALLYSIKGIRNKEGRVDPDAPPSFADTIEERTDVSVGRVDPDTGEMNVDAKIRLWRNSFLGFSVGGQGGYRGILKYIFRFR